MKLYLFMIAILAGFLAGAQTPVTISTTVTEVTAYLNGAQVTRKGQISIPTGTSLLRIPDLAVSTVESSIQISLGPNIRLQSFNFKVNSNFKDQNETARTRLVAEETRLLWLIEEEISIQETLDAEETVLMSNKSIGGVNTGIQTQELKVAMDFFRTRLAELRTGKQKSILTKTKLESQLVDVRSQLKFTNEVKPEPTGELVIKVNATAPQKGELRIEYLVTEASWFPTYDLRVTGINQPIELILKGNFKQNSGEDWKNVRLTASTADPESGKTKPDLGPWILGFNNNLNSSGTNTGMREVTGRIVGEDGPLPGVNITVKGTTVGTVSNANGEYSLVVPSNNSVLVYSFIGLKSEERWVGNASRVDINLEPDVTTLSEMVVVGYGTSVDGLDGKAAGVRIRGLGSQKKQDKFVMPATEVIRANFIEYTLDHPFNLNSTIN